MILKTNSNEFSITKSVTILIHHSLFLTIFLTLPRDVRLDDISVLHGILPHLISLYASKYSVVKASRATPQHSLHILSNQSYPSIWKTIPKTT